MNETAGKSNRVDIAIDPSKVADISRVGVRRAAAFLRLSLQIAELEVPDDISLNVGTNYQFWPSPLQPETKENIRTEFRSWAIGSCFKELESHFSMFFDEVWNILKISEYHGKTILAGGRIELDEKFHKDTNVSNKTKRVLERLGLDPDVTELNSISRARNAMTHAGGRVRVTDAHDSGKLEVSWKSMDLVMIAGDKEVVLNNESGEPLVVDSQSGAHVVVRVVRRTRPFDVGQRIELSARDMAEICLFFSSQTDLIIEAAVKVLAENFKENPSAPDTP